MKKSKKASGSSKYKPGYKGMWVIYHSILAGELAIVVILLAIIAFK